VRTFPTQVKAGPAGGRLRRPSSAGNDETRTANRSSLGRRITSKRHVREVFPLASWSAPDFQANSQEKQTDDRHETLGEGLRAEDQREPQDNSYNAGADS
jgi:hypothetical protein